jgi:hypothetical protein
METCPDLLRWNGISPGGSANCPEAWPTRQGVNMSDLTCSIEDCAKPKSVRGWCQMHYTRWRRQGDPTKVLKYRGSGPIPTACAIDGCERSGPYEREWCRKHYTSWNRYGDPLASRDIRSRKGGCDVDGCDKEIKRNRQCAMHAWRFETYGSYELPPPSEMHYSSEGYIKVRANGHPLADAGGWAYKHRVVLWDKIGPGEHPCHWCATPIWWDLPRGSVARLTADHVDWDKENNEPENLVPACLPCNSVRLRRYL